MKILRNTVLVLCLLGLLVGCRATGRATADYRERSFRAEIRFVRREVTVYAEVEAVRTEGALTLSSVRLIAPPSLSGIELKRENGKLVLSRDGMEMTALGAAEWWETASLLCASGELRYVCDTDWEGLSLEYAEITDGERTVAVYREPETGMPKRIGDETRELTVIRMEEIETRG